MYSTIPPAKLLSFTALSSCRIRSSKSSIQFKYRYVELGNFYLYVYISEFILDFKNGRICIHSTSVDSPKSKDA